MAKYSGQMHIVDRAGDVVGTLTWLGTLSDGTGKWTNMKDQATSQMIADVIARNADLAEIDYHDMLTDTILVRGWQGFSGYFQALEITLPAIGLSVEWETITWPIPPETEPGLET